MNQILNLMRPEDRADFRSLAKAVWQDTDDKAHQQYSIQPMKSGVGFEIIDTYHNANFPVREDFATIEDAEKFLATTPAP
jgi:hypothetical protein